MIQATIRNVWLCVFCLSLLAVGCTSNNSSNRADNQDSQTVALKEVAASTANNENELRDRIEQISQASQGRVGVTAIVLETGESVTLNGDQRFPMQSVYKFPIVMAILAQVDQRNLKLDQKMRIEASDIVRDSRILDENSQGMEYSLAELLALHNGRMKCIPQCIDKTQQEWTPPGKTMLYMPCLRSSIS